MNKNIFKHNALVLILIFILGFVTMFSIKSIYRSRTIELLSNDMYKEDVVYCSQLEYISLNDMKTISNGLFVSKELGSNMRAIYFSTDYRYHLPVIWGRFFENKDFDKNNNAVIVGKNLQKKLKKVDNSFVLEFQNHEYKVIGILGYDIDTVLDNMIFFNLLNVYEQAPIKTDIVFGGNHDEIVEKIQATYSNSEMVIWDIPYTGISRIWSSSYIYSNISIVIMISVLISILLALILKSSYYDQYINVFNILGYKRNLYYLKLPAKEIMMYTVFMLIGESIYTIRINKYYVNADFIKSSLIVSMCVWLLLVIFTLTIFKFKTKRSN